MNESSAQTRAGPAVSRAKVEPWRVRWFVVAATGAIGGIILAISPARELPSFYRHLSSGRTIAENGLPATDPFTVLGSNRPWANPSWLFDLVTYLVHVAVGDYGLVAARVALAILLAAVLFVHDGSDLWSLRPMLIAFGVFALQSNLRFSPELVALILQAVWFTMLGQVGRWSIGSMAVRVFLVQAVWSNVAPTILLCPITLIFSWLGSTLDHWTAGRSHGVAMGHGRFLAALLAALLGTVASPFGLETWQVSWRHCFAAFRMSDEGQSLVDGLMPIWSVQELGVAEISFFMLLAVSAWVGFVPAVRFQTILPLGVLAILAIADIRLRPLCTVWLIRSIQDSCSNQSQTPAEASAGRTVRVLGLLTFAGHLVALGFLIHAVGSGIPEVFREMRRQQSGTTVSETRQRWLQRGELAGSALLLDPSLAGWFEGNQSRLRPVLDDRLELFADDYAMYRGFCLDVVHDRHNSYRRTDGSDGGWRQWAASLPFDWIVSRASDVAANQMLSSSTYWAPAFWDAEIVIFGPKQHPLLHSATARLAELKNVFVHGIDGVPELSPNTPEVFALILENDSWRTYSQREFLDLAKVYYAFDRPEIAFYLLSRVDGSKLLTDRNALLRLIDEKKTRTEFVIQGSGSIGPEQSTH